MKVSLSDIQWLLFHTVPVAGERAAAWESWGNVLMGLGLSRTEASEMLEKADKRWSKYARPGREG